MHKAMNLKGFALILGLMLVVFLFLHGSLNSSLKERAEKEKELRVRLTKLEEENKELNARLNVVGTDEYIMSSAVRDYAYVKRDAIRFEFSNPEVLYAYTEEELQILLDELNN